MDFPAGRRFFGRLPGEATAAFAENLLNARITQRAHDRFHEIVAAEQANRPNTRPGRSCTASRSARSSSRHCAPASVSWTKEQGRGSRPVIPLPQPDQIRPDCQSKGHGGPPCARAGDSRRGEPVREDRADYEEFGGASRARAVLARPCSPSAASAACGSRDGLPVNMPRCGIARISPNGVTRFCRGVWTVSPYCRPATACRRACPIAATICSAT